MQNAKMEDRVMMPQTAAALAACRHWNGSFGMRLSMVRLRYERSTGAWGCAPRSRAQPHELYYKGTII
jgi:hypothetical protein